MTHQHLVTVCRNGHGEVEWREQGKGNELRWIGTLCRNVVSVNLFVAAAAGIQNFPVMWQRQL